VPEHWRTYRLATLLHKLPSEIENESASTLDWILAIDQTFKQVQSEQNGGEQ
jgi:hypothetical protein